MNRLRPMRALRLILAFLLLIPALASCRESSAPLRSSDITLELVRMEPNTYTVGEVTLFLRLQRAGMPLVGAAVEVRGDMNHAGMVPVTGSGQTDNVGIAEVPFEWTMGGVWTLTVTVTTQEGLRRAGQFEMRIES